MDKDPVSSECRLIRINGYPIFAYPAGSSTMRLAALERFQTFTWRRKLLSVIFRVAICFGLDNLMTSSFSWKRESMLEEAVNAALEIIRETLSEDCDSLVFMWPRKDGRRRIYLHMLGPNGKPLAFGKIAILHDDINCLLREVVALRNYKYEYSSIFRVPRVLAVVELGSSCLVLYEPLPPGTRPARPALKHVTKIIEEYGGPIHRIPGCYIRESAWYTSLMGRQAEFPRSFIDGIAHATAIDVNVRRAHGDLSLANICKAENMIWVYDWERFCEVGPAYADELSYRLSFYFRGLQVNPKKYWKLVAMTCRQSPGQPTEGDMLLAVAFLANEALAYAALARAYPGVGAGC